MKLLKLMVALLLLMTVSIFAFYGCKKTSSDVTKEQNDLAEVYKQKLKNEPATATFTVNLPGKGYYGDINGNKQTGSTNGGPCVTQPDGTWVYETWYIN